MNRTGRTIVLTAILIVAGALLGPPSAIATPIDGFTRGDCNSDGYWDISDAISELVWLLAGGPPPACSDACDVNDDGVLDIADGIYALSSLFGTGALPPAPYPECGLDLSFDSLPCELPSCLVTEFDQLRAVTAPTGRVGLPYLGELPALAIEAVHTMVPAAVVTESVPFVAFALPSALPPGLDFDPLTGTIFGTPTEAGWHRFPVVAEDGSGKVHLLRVDLAVFSPSESEIISGQDFTAPGPFAVEVMSDFFIFSHQLIWPLPYPLWSCAPTQPSTTEVNQGKQVRLYLPTPSPGPAPVLLFHHGTGFNHIQYDDILEHFASHGFICASVNDPYSYSAYPVNYCWGGHDEGARVLRGLREIVMERALDPASPLYGRIDFDRVFYGGHSRGAASAIAACEVDRDARGVIALQPTDAKGDSFIGNTDRWDHLPDLPILIISAEQDFDVAYPWAERLFERTTGPTTMATIYGGCHGYSTDDSDNGCLTCTWLPVAPEVDQCRYISRDVQVRLIRQLSVAFLRRYGSGDLTVEGLLYGTEWTGSPYLAFTSQRRLAGTTWIDDFSAYPTNSLGESWAIAGTGAAGIGSCYDSPAPVPTPIVPIENLIVTLPTSGSLDLQTTLATAGEGLDVALHRSVVFRIKNHDRWQLLDNFGFSWLTATLELTDRDGDSVAIPLADFLPTVPYHPEPLANLVDIPLKAQRFLDVRVPLTLFIAANPALDLDELTTLSIHLAVTPTPELNVAPTIGIDDVRFE